MARTKGTWGTVREVPRKGSGRWQASYVYGGIWGVERGVLFTAPQTFDTRGDAYAWLDREHRLVDRDDWTPPGEQIRKIADMTPTVAEYGERYCSRHDLSPVTADKYRGLLRLYINAEPTSISRRGRSKGRPLVKFGVGHVRVTDLTRAHVRHWWSGLPLAEKEPSCKQAYNLLRAIMNSALDDELVNVNPVRLRDARHAQASRESYMDPLPVDILFAVADAMPPQWRLGVFMGGVMAMRSGEVRALQRQDFNLDGEIPTVKVERAVKQYDNALDDELVEINPVRLRDAHHDQANRESDMDPLPGDGRGWPGS